MQTYRRLSGRRFGSAVATAAAVGGMFGGMFLAATPPAVALSGTHPGDLDPTFNGTGTATASFTGDSAAAVDAAVAVLPGPNGTVISVATQTRTGSSNEIYSIALARYLPNGHLDPTFGSGGTEVLANPDPSASYVATSAALLPDGDIAIGGAVEAPTTNGPNQPAARPQGGLHWASPAAAQQAGIEKNGITLVTPVTDVPTVFGVTPAGALDPHFGHGGVATVVEPVSTPEAAVFALSVSGSDLYAGESAFLSSSQTSAIAALTEAGAPDPAFNGGKPSAVGNGGYVVGLVAHSDSLLAATTSEFAGSGNGVPSALTRLSLPGGAPDKTFGGAGTGIYNDSKDAFLSMTATPGGSAVVEFAASSSGSPSGSASPSVESFNTAGVPGKATTLPAGFVSTPFMFTDGAAQMAVQDDGTIVVAGTETTGGGSSQQGALAKLTSGAAGLDRAFGTGGVATIAAVKQVPALGLDLAQRILAVGNPATAAGPGAIPLVTARVLSDSVAGETGYYLFGADGSVAGYGTSVPHGSLAGDHLSAPIVGGASSHGGYWMVGADGGIFTFGGAKFYGSLGAVHLAQPIVGMAATPSGDGYWLVAKDGGVFTFGDAKFYGSLGNVHLAQPVVGIAPTDSGDGYWLVAKDGGVFSFGDAEFLGSEGGTTLAAPVVGMASDPAGTGYWLVGSDGGVFTFGAARFHGSTGGIHLVKPVVTMVSTPDGNGYGLMAADGGVFSFGDWKFLGSSGGQTTAPIVAAG